MSRALGSSSRRPLAVAGAVSLAALVASCGDRAAAPANGPAAADARPAQLTNRVWLDTAGSPPGSMLIFLSDGTLLQDSCWETYRLSRWRSASGQTLRWEEDTAEIAATIVSLTASELVLRLDLRDGPLEQTYAAAAAPYVCPDMPR